METASLSFDADELAVLVSAVRAVRRDARTKAEWSEKNRPGEPETLRRAALRNRSEALYLRLLNASKALNHENTD